MNAMKSWRTTGRLAKVAGCATVLFVAAASQCGATAPTRAVGWTSTRIAGLPKIGGLAADAADNLYITDTAGNRILKESYAAGVYTETVLDSSGLSQPGGLAIDTAGNLYVADTGNGRLVEEVYAGAAYTQKVLRTGMNQPQSVAVDKYGVVYVTVQGGQVLTETPSAGNYVEATAVTGLNTPVDLAVTPDGVIYIADSGAGMVLVETPTTGGYTQQSIPGWTLKPTAVAVEGETTIYVADALKDRVLQFTLSGGIYDGTALAAGITTPRLAALSDGTVLAADNATSKLKQVGTGTASAGESTIGAPTTAVELNFAFAPGAQLSSWKVLTQGLTGGEFADAGTGTCAPGTYALGDLCSVAVSFTPKFPGNRPGAVVLIDSSNRTMATALVTGTGTGPQVLFSPAQTATMALTGPGAALNYPQGMALDGAGNLYVADSTNARVVKIASSGSTTVVGTGSVVLGTPWGVAVDGAGNLYILDTANNSVVQVAADGTVSKLNPGSISMGFITSLAVDGSGNVYVADSTNKDIVVFPAHASAYVMPIAGATLSFPRALAVDGKGNLFIADANNNVVLEVTKGTAFTLATGSINLSSPFALASDSSGRLYVTDAMDRAVVLTPASGTASEVNLSGITLTGPRGIAVSAAGDLYIADSGNSRIVQVSQQNAAALSFVDTKVGQTSKDSPMSIQMTNAGVADLVVSVPSSGENPASPSGFSVGGTCPQISAGTVSASIASLATCTLQVSFVPTATGVNSGAIVLTDNNLGVAGARQSIQASGNGLDSVSALAFGTGPATPISSGGNAGTAITVQEIDALGNVVSNATDTIALNVAGPGGYTASYSAKAVAGVASFDLSAVKLTTQGQYSYTASTGAMSVSIGETVTSAVPVVTLSSSDNPVLVQSSITLSATVSGNSGTPTGTITFFEGNAAVGQSTVSSTGTATLKLTAQPTGSHAYKASYSGDAVYAGASSSTLNEVVEDFTFAMNAQSAQAVEILPGGSATFTFDFAPVGATKLNTAANLTVSGYPANATATLTPSTFAAGTTASTAKLLLNVPKSNAVPGTRQRAAFGGGFSILLLPLLFRIGRRRRILAAWFGLLAICFAPAALLSGCSSGTGTFGQKPQQYTVTVTATAGSVSHSATVSLTVD